MIGEKEPHATRTRGVRSAYCCFVLRHEVGKLYVARVAIEEGVVEEEDVSSAGEGTGEGVFAVDSLMAEV